jgi:hypothetical protein
MQSPVGSRRGPQQPTFGRKLLTSTGSNTYSYDGITPVEYNGQFPESAIFKFAIQYGGHRTVCTAALIAPKVLLTAAHCVYDQEGQFFYNYDYFKFYTAGLQALDAKVDNVVVTTEYTLGVSWQTVSCDLLFPVPASWMFCVVQNPGLCQASDLVHSAFHSYSHCCLHQLACHCMHFKLLTDMLDTTH